MSPLVGAACAVVVVDTRVKFAGTLVGNLKITIPEPPAPELFPESDDDPPPLPVFTVPAPPAPPPLIDPAPPPPDPPAPPLPSYVLPPPPPAGYSTSRN